MPKLRLKLMYSEIAKKRDQTIIKGNGLLVRSYPDCRPLKDLLSTLERAGMQVDMDRSKKVYSFGSSTKKFPLLEKGNGEALVEYVLMGSSCEGGKLKVISQEYMEYLGDMKTRGRIPGADIKYHSGIWVMVMSEMRNWKSKTNAGVIGKRVKDFYE
tara:strand:- start:715 stop:1185 length:471 start_codon:yes stop_codon:yes gene_type:complete